MSGLLVRQVTNKGRRGRCVISASVKTSLDVSYQPEMMLNYKLFTLCFIPLQCYSLLLSCLLLFHLFLAPRRRRSIRRSSWSSWRIWRGARSWRSWSRCRSSPGTRSWPSVSTTWRETSTPSSTTSSCRYALVFKLLKGWTRLSREHDADEYTLARLSTCIWLMIKWLFLSLHGSDYFEWLKFGELFCKFRHCCVVFFLQWSDKLTMLFGIW